MTDATCYESHMRFPTDMKLLWESLEWLYRHICRHCRELGIRRPRNKYRNVAESYLSYCKKRKRRASRTRMLKRRMIKLLEKLLSQRDGIHSEYGALLRYTQDYHKRLSIIRKVLVQEKEMFEGRKVSDRIVRTASMAVFYTQDAWSYSYFISNYKSSFLLQKLFFL